MICLITFNQGRNSHEKYIGGHFVRIFDQILTSWLIVKIFIASKHLFIKYLPWQFQSEPFSLVLVFCIIFLISFLSESKIQHFVIIILFKLSRNRVCTSNHMFGRAIWDKLPECIFENFEITRVKRGQFQNFLKIARMIYSKNCPNQTCDYWLITPNQQTLY